MPKVPFVAAGSVGLQSGFFDRKEFSSPSSRPSNTSLTIRLPISEAVAAALPCRLLEDVVEAVGRGPQVSVAHSAGVPKRFRFSLARPGD